MSNLKQVLSIVRCYVWPRGSRPSRGGILIGTVVAMVAMGALGVGMVSILNSSAYQSVRANLGEQAYYLAESGGRYAGSHYRDGHSNMVALKETFTVPNTGSFTLTDVTFLPQVTRTGGAAWEGTCPVQGGANCLLILASGDGNDLPGKLGFFEYDYGLYRYDRLSGDTLYGVRSVDMKVKLDMEQIIDNGGQVHLPNGSKMPDGGSFRYGGKKYDFAVYDAETSRLMNVTSAADGAFPLLPAVGQILLVRANVPTVNIPVGERIRFIDTLYVASRGEVGSGLFGARRTVENFFSGGFGSSVGGEGDPSPGGEIAEITFEDIADFNDNFDHDGDATFTVEPVPTQHGSNTMLKVNNPDQTYSDPDSPCNVHMGDVIMRLKASYGPVFKKEWHAKNKLLEYDVQVKLKWGWGELYGATGIVFRWQPHPTHTGKYEGYGVSFMRYRGSSCLDIGDGYPEGEAIYGDRMPNSMKPWPMDSSDTTSWWWCHRNNNSCPIHPVWDPIAAAPVCWEPFDSYDNYVCPKKDGLFWQFTGSDRLNEKKNLHTLLVLWEQYVDQNGKEVRRWLAYKDLGMVALVITDGDYENYQKQRLREYFTQPGGMVVGSVDDYDEYLLGLQPDWDYDGVHINDLSTLGVRVEEVYEGGVKKNHVKVFYGDASTHYTNRSTATLGDPLTTNVAYDKEYHRSQRSMPASPGDNWPVWPAEYLKNWRLYNDRYTMMGRNVGLPAGQWMHSGQQYLQWDALNPVAENVDRVSWVAPNTLVLPDFTSPNDQAGWSGRNEIGLHVFGNFGDRQLDWYAGDEDHEYAAFDDFSVRFIHTSHGSGGGPVVQR